MKTRKGKTICLTESNQNVEQGGVRIDLASTHNTYIHIIGIFLSSYFICLRANFHQINKFNLNFASLLFFLFGFYILVSCFQRLFD